MFDYVRIVQKLQLSLNLINSNNVNPPIAGTLLTPPQQDGAGPDQVGRGRGRDSPGGGWRPGAGGGPGLGTQTQAGAGQGLHRSPGQWSVVSGQTPHMLNDCPASLHIFPTCDSTMKVKSPA